MNDPVFCASCHKLVPHPHACENAEQVELVYVSRPPGCVRTTDERVRELGELFATLYAKACDGVSVTPDEDEVDVSWHEKVGAEKRQFGVSGPTILEALRKAVGA